MLFRAVWAHGHTDGTELKINVTTNVELEGRMVNMTYSTSE